MADAGEDLFSYNRGNFMFDQKLRQWREYQEQNMRVKRFMQYREDMRDLNELTISKMDSYLMIAVLELGCCLDLLVHGVLKMHTFVKDEPTWNLWLYVISLAEAFVWLFLSAWLAIHASVSAHSFTVRLLTQFVRLPVPNTEQLDAAAATGTDFENMGVQDILRIPIIRQQAERLNAVPETERAGARGPSGEAAVSGLVMSSADGNQTVAQKHVRVFRNLQVNWQAHDAYARACLALGTYKLIHALAYYTVGLLALEMQAPWACCVCVVVLPALAWLLIRLDVYFDTRGPFVIALVLMLGPALAMIAATLSLSDDYENHENTQFVLIAVIFAMHALLIVCVAHVAKGEPVSERGAALPVRFRNVLYVDVFGLIQSPEQVSRQRAQGAPQTQNGREMPPMLREALYKESSRLGQQLVQEFTVWESADLNFSTALMRQRRALQEEFHRLCTDFKKMHEANVSRSRCENEDVSWVPLDESPTSGSERNDDNQHIWLRLECHSGSEDRERITWFVQPSKKETRYEPPETEGGQAFISDIAGVAGRLEMLRERVDVLQEDAVLTRERGFQSRFARMVGGLLPSGGESSVPPAPDSPAHQGQVASAAQETRFGGRESAEQGGVFLATEATGQTFHPRRDRRSDQSREPPHKEPSWVFNCAGAVLFIVWFGGIAWYVVYPFAMGSGRKKGRIKAISPELTDASLIMGSEEWTSRPGPLQPVGLACDHNHSSMVIAERFALHEVWMPTFQSGVMQQSPQKSGLNNCLAEHPGFLADGLNGVRIKCTNPLDCHALVLGAQDNQFLVCPLGSSSRCRPTLLTSNEAQPRRRAGCFVDQRDLKGMLPEMSFTTPEASVHFLDREEHNGDGQENRVLLEDKLVITLSDPPERSLGVSMSHAWAVGEHGRKHLGSWRFPATHRWISMCHAKDQIFVLGVPQASWQSPELWSFAMPEEIRGL